MYANIYVQYVPPTGGNITRNLFGILRLLLILSLHNVFNFSTIPIMSAPTSIAASDNLFEANQQQKRNNTLQ